MGEEKKPFDLEKWKKAMEAITKQINSRPGGLRQGITWNDNGTYSIELLAPDVPRETPEEE